MPRFILDNTDSHTIARTLRDALPRAARLDIASGYFDIGALLALDGTWQALPELRLLMGDEVPLTTADAFTQATQTLTDGLEDSIEAAKEADDFSLGLPAIAHALRTGQIGVRIYRRRKFHAKAYLFSPHADEPPFAIVGSSNFTTPGLTQNLELNIRLDDPAQITELQAWFETHWADSVDLSLDVLRIMERHTREYTPFEVYTRALDAYFRDQAPTVGEWEKHDSRMYSVLDQYQREGYHALTQIAERFGGALLCDGVGLGKTFIGLMVIERLLQDRRRVALIVPKAARVDVWENNLRRYLPHLLGRFSNLVIYNHTDLLRGGDYPELIQELADKVDAIVIDEAHHFRNVGSARRGGCLRLRRVSNSTY